MNLAKNHSLQQISPLPSHFVLNYMTYVYHCVTSVVGRFEGCAGAARQWPPSAVGGHGESQRDNKDVVSSILSGQSRRWRSPIPNPESAVPNLRSSVLVKSIFYPYRSDNMPTVSDLATLTFPKTSDAGKKLAARTVIGTLPWCVVAMRTTEVLQTFRVIM
jgi:hypothetical protein